MYFFWLLVHNPWKDTDGELPSELECVHTVLISVELLIYAATPVEVFSKILPLVSVKLNGTTWMAPSVPGNIEYQIVIVAQLAAIGNHLLDFVIAHVR